MTGPVNIRSFRAQVGKLATVEEKVNYCAQIIYDTHNFLRTNNVELPRGTKSKAMVIIATAETQLFKLIKK